jgi:hypothetical protein
MRATYGEDAGHLGLLCHKGGPRILTKRYDRIKEVPEMIRQQYGDTGQPSRKESRKAL